MTDGMQEAIEGGAGSNWPFPSYTSTITIRVPVIFKIITLSFVLYFIIDFRTNYYENIL